MMAKSKTSWQSGLSGNPKGRPKGRSLTSQLRDVLEPQREEIITKLITLAKGGDLQAMSLVLKYLYPLPKPTYELVDLGKFGNTPAEQARALWDAVARGLIPVDIGTILMAMLCDVCKVAESTELAECVEELKSRLDELKTREGKVH